MSYPWSEIEISLEKISTVFCDLISVYVAMVDNKQNFVRVIFFLQRLCLLSSKHGKTQM